MAKCPHCGTEVTLNANPANSKTEVRREVKGLLKKEVLYSCPSCEKVLGFGSFFGGVITGRP
ncbi:MAG: hypothetical protein K1X53_13760 [Candidatus Sumerlaeaceae bacterium]|nr:hypothetical protein [Candidatus Sumerlaeaceae bacterium]